MSTLSELQKKLQQESQGIMFPFSAATSAVNTTQQVYDSSTDGIMTMTGKKYTGPNAVVQYGTEAQGYTRQLKQIEAPMLPQVSNLPPQGTGIVENAPGTTVPDPITETPVEQPTVNPCPSGYRLVNGVCQLIPQRNDNKENLKGIPVTKGIIEGYTRAALTPNQFSTGALNSNEMMALEKKYGSGVASQIGLIDQQFNRGTQVKHVKEKINNPKTGELIEVDATNPDGTIKVENVIAISPTFSQALAEVSPITLVEDVVKSLAEKVFGNEVFKKEEIPKKIITSEIVPETKMNFRELSKNFGVLQSSLLDTTSQLTSIQENMLNMMKGRGTDTVELAKLKKQEKKLKAKKDREQKAVTVAQAEIDKFVKERVTAPESYKIETKDDGKTARERINDRKAALEKNKERFAKTSDGRTNYKEGVGFTKGR